MAASPADTKTRTSPVECGQRFRTDTLGRVRVRSVDFDSVRVVRIDEQGETIPGDYSTHKVLKADLGDDVPDVPAAPVAADEPTTYVSIARGALPLLLDAEGTPQALYRTMPSSDPYRDERTALVAWADLTWLVFTLEHLTHEFAGREERHAITATLMDAYGAQAELMAR